MNLHQDIETATTTHFAFLQEMGFSPFQTEQLAYEIHFRSKRDGVCVDVWYEVIYSTPIWITVNGLHVTILEPRNAVIERLYNEKDALYKENFQKYLKEDDAAYLKKNEVLYGEKGHGLNSALLEEAAHILQRHKEVLSAGNTRMALIQKALEQNPKTEKLHFAKANGIFTCEYDWSGLTCEHEGTLDEIEAHLLERADMHLTNIIVFDPDGNIVEALK